jgi:molecular chaperone IbpA
MTNGTLTLRSLDIPSIHKFGIGFDSIFDELHRLNATQANTNYPPYNIVKISEDKFAIEFAVAGFNEGEVTLELENSVLTIAGNKVHDLDNLKEYLHRGISNRNFQRSFTLADHVEVREASTENGILTVFLERIVPEDKKPKNIAIKYNK